MRSLAIILLLAGCTTQPFAPDGTDYILISSGSGFIGRSSDWIYANDTLRREDEEPNQSGPSKTWQQLPEGTYDAARAILTEGIPTVSAPEFDLCPTDMGVNSISFTQAIAGTEAISAGCMDNGFFPVKSRIMDLLPPR